MELPSPQHSIAALIDKAHEARAASDPERFREHLGASLLGHPCSRWLWLSFRWAVAPTFPGRVLRLFRRGQNEEAQIVSDLRAIGIDIRETGDHQRRISPASHLGGSIDGIIYSGVPEAPKKRHIAEFKTHSLKSFEKVSKEGVQAAHPQHWVQMQLYMYGTHLPGGDKIDRALYVAVCKDDDRLYTERVEYDKEAAERYIQRGADIVAADRPPPRISENPSWYQCKMCQGYDLCHGSKLTRSINCRTCAHSTPLADTTWRCERHDADGIPVEWQRTGCESHALHPDLVPWEQAEPVDQWTPVFVINGKKIANGEADAHIFSSREIVANPAACDPEDEELRGLREGMEGRVVG
jgi:hypothetical protein